MGASQKADIINMDDFDAIYEEDVNVTEEPVEDERHAVLVPEPITLRGAGNMTVYDWLMMLLTCIKHNLNFQL